MKPCNNTFNEVDMPTTSKGNDVKLCCLPSPQHPMHLILQHCNILQPIFQLSLSCRSSSTLSITFAQKQKNDLFYFVDASLQPQHWIISWPKYSHVDITKIWKLNHYFNHNYVFKICWCDHESTWFDMESLFQSTFNPLGKNPMNWGFIYIIRNLLKLTCLKWACIAHLDIWNINYGPKKRSGVKWAIWLPTTKS
jgi:hypothetical protein